MPFHIIPHSPQVKIRSSSPTPYISTFLATTIYSFHQNRYSPKNSAPSRQATPEPATDSIIVNTGENSILVIHCKECNSSVIFDDPSDVVYLYHLAEETPLLYAKLALKANGLQDYVNAMNEIN